MNFVNSNTRAGTNRKLNHKFTRLPVTRNLYFTRVVRLWNAIPNGTIDLDLSVNANKFHLRRFFWSILNIILIRGIYVPITICVLVLIVFISVRIVVVIIELFLEWFRLSVTSFCLFSHTLSFISSTLVVTGKQILLLLLLLLFYFLLIHGHIVFQIYLLVLFNRTKWQVDMTCKARAQAKHGHGRRKCRVRIPFSYSRVSCISKCGYHALDNVYAVKGSTATRKTNLLLLLLPHSKQAVLFTLHRVIPQLRPVLLSSYLPRSTRVPLYR